MREAARDVYCEIGKWASDRGIESSSCSQREKRGMGATEGSVLSSQ